MKRMIMSLATVASLFFNYTVSAQSGKNVGQRNSELPAANSNGNNNLRETQTLPAREPRGVNSPAAALAPATMNQDTTRPRRDTMRSPQPVPPVPPVPPAPIPSDTPGRK